MRSREPWPYRMIRAVINAFYPAYTQEGTENIPGEAAVFVGNHAHAHGPLTSELRLPFPHRTWCIGTVMNPQEAADYAYSDFWSKKPEAVRWLYRMLSHVAARPLSYVLCHARTVPVFHDNRIMTTMKQSLEALDKGEHLVIFPETYEGYNHFLCVFQAGFVDTAKLYFKRTGKCLSFVPMYIAPQLKKIVYGEPIRFRPEVPLAEERERITAYLMDAVTQLALAQPLHRVVPYPNISRRDYPQNVLGEVLRFETPGV